LQRVVRAVNWSKWLCGFFKNKFHLLQTTQSSSLADCLAPFKISGSASNEQVFELKYTNI